MAEPRVTKYQRVSLSKDQPISDIHPHSPALVMVIYRHNLFILTSGYRGHAIKRFEVDQSHRRILRILRENPSCGSARPALFLRRH